MLTGDLVKHTVSSLELIGQLVLSPPWMVTPPPAVASKRTGVVAVPSVSPCDLVLGGLVASRSYSVEDNDSCTLQL